MNPEPLEVLDCSRHVIRRRYQGKLTSVHYLRKQNSFVFRVPGSVLKNKVLFRDTKRSGKLLDQCLWSPTWRKSHSRKYKT